MIYMYSSYDKHTNRIFVPRPSGMQWTCVCLDLCSTQDKWTKAKHEGQKRHIVVRWYWVRLLTTVNITVSM